MKNALSLPIASYRNHPSVSFLVSETEPPVEGGLSRDFDPFSLSDSVERLTNGQIDQASFNAELNRRVSSDSTKRPDCCDTSLVKHKRSRVQSVSFGTESEVEYCCDETPKLIKKTVRCLKEFDGNRSGRPSVKQ